MEVLDYRMAALRVVRIRGMMGEPEVASFVRKVYRDLLREPGDVLLNLEGVDRICTYGVAVICQLAFKLERFGARVGLVVPAAASQGWESLLAGKGGRVYPSELEGIHRMAITERAGSRHPEIGRNLRNSQTLIDDRESKGIE